MTRDRRRRKAADAGARKAVNKLAVPPEVLLGYRLWEVHHRWQRYIEKSLKAVNLTHLQYVLLAATCHLISVGESPSQIRLSNFTNIEKMMVSKNLRLLEKRGYMAREPHPDDRRANQIRLTVTGQRVLRRAFAISAKAQATFFYVVGNDWARVNEQLRHLIHSRRR